MESASLRRRLRLSEGFPDARVVAPEELVFGRRFWFTSRGGPNGAVLHEDSGADGAFQLEVGVAGEGAGPGDVAVAGGVEGVSAFGEDPLRTVKGFAQGEVIGSDVCVGSRETFFGDGELVHEGKAEFVFFGGEAHGQKPTAEVLFGLPTDLIAETSAVAGAFDIAQLVHEIEENSFKEMPVIGADGEEGAEPEFVAFCFIGVEDGEVALAAGGDIETEAGGVDS